MSFSYLCLNHVEDGFNNFPTDASRGHIVLEISLRYLSKKGLMIKNVLSIVSGDFLLKIPALGEKVPMM